MATRKVPKSALWLTIAGALPFLVFSALSFFSSRIIGINIYDVLTTYAAIILAFVGGIQWGFACHSENENNESILSRALLAISITPAIIGWASLFADDPFRILILSVAFLGVLVVDVSMSNRGLTPLWWISLRAPVSGVVVVSLIAASFSAVF